MSVAAAVQETTSHYLTEPTTLAMSMGTAKTALMHLCTAVGGGLLLSALAAPPHAIGQGRSAAEVMARARDTRGLQVMASQSRPPASVRVLYDYSPTWQKGAAGTLEITFTPPGLTVRREHFPWNRFHTAETTIDDGLFRRWFRELRREWAGNSALSR